MKTAIDMTSLFDLAFELEREHTYPAVDDFERRMGAALDRAKLETAARVLACPVKKNPPNWQHGRVIYAAAYRALTNAMYSGVPPSPVLLLDVGTAKGFSALCLTWALHDAGIPGHVVSVDVIDPEARVSRNTVAEVDGFKTLREILAPWPESRAIEFVCSTGRAWLANQNQRIHVAFVDGKHTYDAVSWEAALIAARQQTGDFIIFDDVQIDGVARAVKTLSTYFLECVVAIPGQREYAIARRV